MDATYAAPPVIKRKRPADASVDHPIQPPAVDDSASNWERMRGRGNKPAAASTAAERRHGPSSSRTCATDVAAGSSVTANNNSGSGHQQHTPHTQTRNNPAVRSYLKPVSAVPPTVAARWTGMGAGVSSAVKLAVDAGRISFGALAKTVKNRPQAPAAVAAADSPVAVDLSGVLGPFPAPLSAEEKRYMALDCEMVGVGSEGRRSILAQVVVVDWAGSVRYCAYVQPSEPVTDYRTQFSGVLPEHLRGSNAVSFSEAQAAVSFLIAGKVVVGHGLINDMKALMLSHPWTATRDTAKYRPFCRPNRTGKLKPRRLKHLVQEHLGVAIQEGEHDPAVDARGALALYKLHRRAWEEELRHSRVKGAKKGRLGAPKPGAAVVLGGFGAPKIVSTAGGVSAVSGGAQQRVSGGARSSSVSPAIDVQQRIGVRPGGLDADLSSSSVGEQQQRPTSSGGTPAAAQVRSSSYSLGKKRRRKGEGSVAVAAMA